MDFSNIDLSQTCFTLDPIEPKNLVLGFEEPSYARISFDFTSKIPITNIIIYNADDIQYITD